MNAVAISLLCLGLWMLVEAGTVQRQTDPQIEAVRLVGGRHIYSGRVEVMADGVWGLVCSDLFNEDATRVVCRSLGFPSDNSRVVRRFGGYPSGIDTLLDDVVCLGTEATLNECQHRPIGIHNCAPSEIVNIDCERAHPLFRRTRRFGNGDGPIFLDDLDCNGDEANLGDCDYNSLNNCYHISDIGVRCGKY